MLWKRLWVADDGNPDSRSRSEGDEHVNNDFLSMRPEAEAGADALDNSIPIQTPSSQRNSGSTSPSPPFYMTPLISPVKQSKVLPTSPTEVETSSSSVFNNTNNSTTVGNDDHNNHVESHLDPEGMLLDRLVASKPTVKKQFVTHREAHPGSNGSGSPNSSSSNSNSNSNNSGSPRKKGKGLFGGDDDEDLKAHHNGKQPMHGLNHVNNNNNKQSLSHNKCSIEVSVNDKKSMFLQDDYEDSIFWKSYCRIENFQQTSSNTTSTSTNGN